MDITLTVDTAKIKDDFGAVGEKFVSAFAAARNMIASMILSESLADIREAGNFGEDFTSSLKVTIEGDTITTTLDAPGASVFETGGTIHGNPLLWLPISGTDAVGIKASNYGGGLFSVNRKAGGPPLLFSIADHMPKYFGTPSVNIPKKFHLAEIQTNVMGDFENVFSETLEEALKHG